MAHLTNSPPEVPIAGGHDVALVLPNPLAYAVIGIRPFVGARNPLYARVLHRTTARSR